MTTLPPYDPNSTCPKCGSAEVTTTYEAPFGSERMRRKCMRCGYGWIEAPLRRALASTPQGETI